MLSAQAGVCAICKCPETSKWKGRIRQLAVDHDHVTGHVRGLLCDNCNSGVGSFRNEPAVLRAAAAYLEHYLERRPPTTVAPRTRNPNHWAKTLKPCVTCGQEVALTSWGLYCSHACRIRAARARKKKGNVSEGRVRYVTSHPFTPAAVSRAEATGRVTTLGPVVERNAWAVETGDRGAQAACSAAPLIRRTMSVLRRSNQGLASLSRGI